MQQIKKIKDKQEESQGNGKAVFLGDMDQEEFEEYNRMEIQGWKKLYNKIKNYDSIK